MLGVPPKMRKSEKHESGECTSKFLTFITSITLIFLEKICVLFFDSFSWEYSICFSSQAHILVQWVRQNCVLFITVRWCFSGLTISLTLMFTDGLTIWFLIGSTLTKKKRKTFLNNWQLSFHRDGKWQTHSSKDHIETIITFGNILYVLGTNNQCKSRKVDYHTNLMK